MNQMIHEKTKKIKLNIDSASSVRKIGQTEIDFEAARYINKFKHKSWLLSNKGRFENFYTADSGTYVLPEDLSRLRRGERVFEISKKFDCILPRGVRKRLQDLTKQKLSVTGEIKERYAILEDYWSQLLDGSIRSFGLSRTWNISIVASMIFGMFLMTMLYRYLGPGASAVAKTPNVPEKQAIETVLGDEDAKKEDEITQKLLAEYQELLKKGDEKDAISDKIREMTKGYPIEKMAGEIASKDKVIAAFLVGIAMKESTWGKHVPVLDGKDCYNYWGYRGKRARMGTGGHTCFDSRKDAVDTVAKRLEFLVNNEKITTPDKMVTVWKCGYDCSWDTKQAVQKWISDVDKYFDKFNEKAED
jgi:hypothetical protein